MALMSKPYLRVCLLWFVLVLLTAGCAGTPAPPVVAEAPTQETIQMVPLDIELVILADLATMRTGPGLNYENLGNIERNTLVMATGQTADGSWFRVQSPVSAAEEVWIASEFTKPTWFATQKAFESITPTATITSTPSPTPLPPEDTAAPMPTPTNTEPLPAPEPTDGPILISASIPTYCRSGASQVFDLLGTLLPGNQVEVYGRSPDGLWWYIQNPDWPASGCWIWNETTSITGEFEQVPLMFPPPTPVPTLVRGMTDTPMPPTATLEPAATDTSLPPTPIPTATFTATTTASPTASSTPSPTPTLAEPATLTPTNTVQVTGVAPVGTP